MFGLFSLSVVLRHYSQPISFWRSNKVVFDRECIAADKNQLLALKSLCSLDRSVQLETVLNNTKERPSTQWFFDFLLTSLQRVPSTPPPLLHAFSHPSVISNKFYLLDFFELEFLEFLLLTSNCRHLSGFQVFFRCSATCTYFTKIA